MTLEEAYTIATELEADANFAVIAIGRFELVCDLVAAAVGAFPWAVSVASRIDPDYRAVLRSREAVDEFVSIAPKPKRQRPALSQAKPTKPPAKPAEQAVFSFE